MVIDASVWVSLFRADDVHHGIATSFVEAAIAARAELHVPNLAPAEIAGVFARQTQSTKLATRTVRAALAIPGVQRHGCDDALADQAYMIAARCKLRGADAVYAALAQHLRMPLITFDREILLRTARLVRGATPAEWLQSKDRK